jgi:hypothetical protein
VYLDSARRTKEEERRIRKGRGRTGNKEEKEKEEMRSVDQEIENTKRRAKLASLDQTSRSYNHQSYCSTEEFAAEVILRKLSRI